MRTLSLGRLVRLAGAATAFVLAACGGSTGPADVPAAQVVLSDTAVSVRVGDDAAVTARARNTAGQDLVGRPIFWSSRDTTVATVTQAGVVHGVAPGRTQISASAEGQSATATVAVVARPIASFVVDPIALQLFVGASQRLAARATNDLGGPVSTAVTWTSLTPDVVSVTADGVVTAIAPGAGRVRATTAGIIADAAVVVSPVPAASVRVTPAAAALTVGATQQLTATPYDAAGNALAGRALSWSSRNSRVAAVSSTGQVTAIAPGTDTVDATLESQVASAVITVRLAPVARVTVAPASSSVGVGGNLALTAVTADANGTPLAGRTVTWTSSAPTVARVDANGTVTGVSAATATITAASEGVTGTAIVRVVAPPPATTASVAVTPSSATLARGASATFTATARASDSTVLTGRTATWTTSAPTIATVTNAGLVTAVAPGTATIAATIDGFTGAATVTVPQPVASVVVTPTTTNFLTGATAQLTAALRDAAGNALTGRVVTWTSSNTSFVTVSSAGVVTAVAPGSATITATSEGMSGTAAVTVISVRIAPTAVTVTTRGSGRMVQLSAIDQGGRTLSSSEVTWTSSNPNAATVDANGLVRAVSTGGAASVTVTITARYLGATATATVTVTP